MISKETKPFKRVLVTGAGGFVGWHMLNELKRAGHMIRATDLPNGNPTRYWDLGIQYVPADITDPSTLPPAFEDVDAVVHLAAIMNYTVDYPALRKVNVDGTHFVCQAAMDAGVKKFVYISSAEIYGFAAELPATENCPANPSNRYGKSKWEGEQVAWDWFKKGLPVTVLRPTAIYGKGSMWGAVTPVVLLYKRLLAFYPGPPHTRSHVVHVEDVVGAARFILEHADSLGEAYNIADASPGTLKDMMDLGARVLGRKVFNFAVPPPLLRATTPMAEFFARATGTDPILNEDMLGAFTRDHVFDVSKIMQLGYELRHPSLMKSLAEVVTWYKDTGFFDKISIFYQKPTVPVI